jgi:hypothetical protein
MVLLEGCKEVVMIKLLFILLLIIAVILTLWFVLIPAGVLAGSFTALRHRGLKGLKSGRRH